MFQVKYTVADLENVHKSLKNEIQTQSEELHTLYAEWSYLNDPARIQVLAQKYLKLVPIKGEQIIPYSELKNSGLGAYDRQELNKIIKKVVPQKRAP
ncbi:MAG: hypothetical protein LBR89_02490 [Holosporales bacterium]|nr:hypothetical protein [Holosporales bacterium]